MSSLAELLDPAERTRPDAVALVARGERITYGRLAERSRRRSAVLAGVVGVRHGDVVALLAPNSAEFVVTYLAVVRLGAIVQPIDERLSPDEIAVVLADSRARVVVVHHALWHKFERIRARLPEVAWILGAGVDAPGVLDLAALEDTAGASPAPIVAAHDVAELMYTSGTTGAPKGVMRSHANVGAAIRNSIRGFGYAADDVILIVMPLSHSSALNSQMLPMLTLGARLVLLETFQVEAVLDLVRGEGVTCMRAVPAMLRLLLADEAFREERLPSLRLLINSSATIDPETYVEVKRRFPDVRVLNSYGLTEASTCTVLPDTQALERPDSVGVPIDGVEMCVRDEAGTEVHAGVEGEIHVRGEHVFVGYRGSAHRRSVRADGWLPTGDIGHRDAEGFYFLHGRCDDVINCGGRKVAPTEIEHVILGIEGVADAAVVGMPHRVLGEVVKAFVVAREGVTLERRAVQQHCARRLASHKVPFVVELVRDLPRNAVGKVLRRTLREVANV